MTWVSGCPEAPDTCPALPCAPFCSWPHLDAGMNTGFIAPGAGAVLRGEHQHRADHQGHAAKGHLGNLAGLLESKTCDLSKPWDTHLSTPV